MDIIVPLRKKRRRRKLLAGAAVLVCAAAIAGAAVWAVSRFSPAPPLPPAEIETPAERAARLNVETLENEIRGLTDAMRMAEEFGDRAKYMEIAAVSAGKNLEADDAWRKWQSERRGLRDGLEDGIFETWMKRFTAEDKFGMLAERHGLSVDALKFLKAEIEVLFAEELAGKFGVPHEDAAESAEEEPAP